MRFHSLPHAVKIALLLFLSCLLFAGLTYAGVSPSARLHLRMKFFLYCNGGINPEIQIPLRFYDYTVKQDDTIWDISRTTGISMDAIVSCNRIDKPHSLQLHRLLKIPSFSGVLYLPRSNETPEQIAENHNSTVSKIFHRRHFCGIDHICSELSNAVFIQGASFSLRERAERFGTDFFSPLAENRITCGWGFRIHPITRKRSFHKGIDLGAPVGTMVYSARAGRVIFSGYLPGYGLNVLIAHTKNHYKTRYAHLNRILVRTGQSVGNQQPIGHVGQTGTATGPHLHFEVNREGVLINPRDVTDFR